MKVLAIIGPSGSGKSTVIRELHHRGVIEVVPSWTTRPLRDEEAGDRIDPRFVTGSEFAELENAGYFLEVVEMFGFRYGLPAITPPQDAKVPTISVRASLLHLVDEHLPDHIIYQFESPLEIVRDRIGARRVPHAEVDARLRSYTEERRLGRRLADRSFDTSVPLPGVVDAIERAIAADFHVERSSR